MHPVALLVLLISLCIAACTPRQDGIIEGTVSPPGTGIRVAAHRQEKQIAATDVGAQDGKYRLPLPPGTYDVVITSARSPLPLRFPDVQVSPKETTILPLVVLGPATGSGSIKGIVRTSGVAAKVSLLEEGIERSAAATGADGRYEFEGLPEGRYMVRVQAPGYANNTVAVTVSGDRQAAVDIRMLYMTSIEGVDWSKGTLKVRGIGLPPIQAPSPTIRREMARRAAVADAERNLLRAMEMLQVGPTEKLTDALGGAASVQRLQGYLKGYRVAAERDLDGGRIEIELELPLTGADGLTAMLSSR